VELVFARQQKTTIIGNQNQKRGLSWKLIEIMKIFVVF
jgi:hypothetical protein